MPENFESSNVGAKYSWAVLKPNFCPMMLLASVKFVCAFMGLVVGVFPFTTSLELSIVAVTISALIISGLATALG